MRPLLGTIVSIGIEEMAGTGAHAAIDRGFAAVAEIHRLMSFHEATSKVSHLNREAWRTPVPVDPHVRIVLERSLEIASASRGVFDITIASNLVASGLLPRPEGAPEPDAAASWRDIEILADGRVRFAKPLWIDLGGIAKGYAVDCAIEAMALPDHVQCCVNAGGDLRVSGPSPRPIQLAMTAEDLVPVIALQNASLASSTSARRLGAMGGAHVDGRHRRKVGSRRFASVVAQSCMVADALTKPVLAKGDGAQALLRKFDAVAYVHGARSGWNIVGQEI